jgi:hypothetical protein
MMRIGVISTHEVTADEFRFNSGYYLSVDRILSEALKRWQGETREFREIADAFSGPIFRRIYVDDPKQGRKYVSASDLDRTDHMGCRVLSHTHGKLLEKLRLHPETTIVTCSGVNLGWGMFVRQDLGELVGSHDLIRVVSREPEESGYLAAFLCSRPGWVLLRSLIYGTSIKHIEPEQVLRLTIPWPSADFRIAVGDAFIESASKRSRSVELIETATSTLFNCVGLCDLSEGEWDSWGRDLGFESTVTPRSLRAWNYAPRATRLLERLRSVEHRRLADLVRPGSLKKGPSFTRIDALPPHSVQLIGQRQLFRYVPDGRHVGRDYVPASAYCNPDTVLIASVGTFGEAEVFCRAQYVSQLTSRWAYSNHILRVVGEKGLAGWLYAFLRSRTAFRLLRSFATGSKQQDLHPEMLAELPVPTSTDSAYGEVQGLVTEAFELRDQAFLLEYQAKRQIKELLLKET